MVAAITDFRGQSNKHSGNSGLPTQLNVLHSGECPLRGGFAVSLTEWARDTAVEASWHYFVDPITIAHFIDDSLSAWHASEANPMSNGFEQAGYARFSRAEWTTADGMVQLDNLAWIMAQTALRDGIPLVWLTTDQVTAITSGRDRITKGFCTHRQIDPETRTDPGDNYPFDLLTERIAIHMGLAQEEEDDMSILDEPIIRKGAGPLSGFPTTLRDVIAYSDANIHGTREMIKQTVTATVTAIFRTKFPREGGPAGETDLASTIAYLDSNLDRLDDREILNPEAVTAAIAQAADDAFANVSITLSAEDPRKDAAAS